MRSDEFAHLLRLLAEDPEILWEEIREMIPTLYQETQFEEYDKYDLKNCKTNFYLNKKAQKRAVIPQDVRNQVLEAFDND